MIGPIFRRPSNGFSLVELLVVIGVIALLISILLPTLSKARLAARSTACKSMLRQYAMATEMYTIDNKGWMPDSHKFLHYDEGLPRYMGKNVIIEKVARCPGDQITEEMSRLGMFTPTIATGETYEVRASYGAGENSLSASARPTSVGPRPFWVKRNFLKGDSTKIMIWADWQNNPRIENPTVAVVKPVNNNMGSLCFRHPGSSNGVANAAFLDGHVGELHALVKTKANGHDLDVDNWPIPAGESSVGGAQYKYYPFGPGKSQGVGYIVKGYWPGIEIR